MEQKTVMDLSQYNTVEQMGTALQHCYGVILRLGFRGSSVGGLKKDSRFAQYVQQVIALGYPWGVYFVTQAVSCEEAVEEAVYCIGELMALDRSRMTLGIWLDSEYSGPGRRGRADEVSRDRRTEYARVFCDKLKLSGYPGTGIYCSESWARQMLNREQIPYPFWIAKYGNDSGKPGKAPETDHIMWQYTSNGSVPGIRGRVDLSLLWKQL